MTSGNKREMQDWGEVRALLQAGRLLDYVCLERRLKEQEGYHQESLKQMRDYVRALYPKKLLALASDLAWCARPERSPRTNLAAFAMMLKWPSSDPTYASTCTWFAQSIPAKVREDLERFQGDPEAGSLLHLDMLGEDLGLEPYFINFVVDEEGENSLESWHVIKKLLVEQDVSMLESREDEIPHSYGVETWRHGKPAGGAVTRKVSDKVRARPGYFVSKTQMESIVSGAALHEGLEVRKTKVQPGRVHFMEQIHPGGTAQFASWVLPVFDAHRVLISHSVWGLWWE